MVRILNTPVTHAKKMGLLYPVFQPDLRTFYARQTDRSDTKALSNACLGQSFKGKPRGRYDLHQKHCEIV